LDIAVAANQWWRTSLRLLDEERRRFFRISSIFSRAFSARSLLNSISKSLTVAAPPEEF
jgi:hypothetical protein